MTDDDPYIASVVRHARAKQSVSDVKTAFKLLSILLRKDRVPKSGREFLAELCDAIARGEDLTRFLFPKNRYKKDHSYQQVMLFAEQLKAQGVEHEDIYKRVGKRFGGLTPGTAEKYASKGRTQFRDGLKHQLKLGVDRVELVALAAKTFDLPAASIEALLLAD